MNILLTNDDGIAAPGIWAAAEALADLGQVTMVAPATNYSGYGAALPPARSYTCFPYCSPHGQPASVKTYGLAATPATCAQVGLSGVLGGWPFDLVVSGINLGANLGLDILYSGTVGAALTAHLLGIPAIAVSLDANSNVDANWRAAAWALGEVVCLWQANPQDAPVVFNVNVPNLPLSYLAGTLIAVPTKDSFLTRYRFSLDAGEEQNLAVIRDNAREPLAEPWTDAAAVRQGYVAVTPIRAFPDLLCVVPWARRTDEEAALSMRVSELVA